MIRNNVVWIHWLIKHCFRSWTDKFGDFYTFVHEMTGQGPPAKRKHVNNFRCDLFCNAGKTAQPWAMNTDGILIARSKLRKYCHEKLCQLFVNVHSLLFMHDRINQGEVGSTVSNFQNGRHLEPCGCQRVSPTQLLNHKESMQIIDKIIPCVLSLCAVMLLITWLGSNTVICQSRLC